MAHVRQEFRLGAVCGFRADGELPRRFRTGFQLAGAVGDPLLQVLPVQADLVLVLAEPLDHAGKCRPEVADLVLAIGRETGRQVPCRDGPDGLREGPKWTREATGQEQCDGSAECQQDGRERAHAKDQLPHFVVDPRCRERQPHLPERGSGRSRSGRPGVCIPLWRPNDFRDAELGYRSMTAPAGRKGGETLALEGGCRPIGLPEHGDPGGIDQFYLGNVWIGAEGSQQRTHHVQISGGEWVFADIGKPARDRVSVAAELGVGPLHQVPHGEGPHPGDGRQDTPKDQEVELCRDAVPEWCVHSIPPRRPWSRLGVCLPWHRSSCGRCAFIGSPRVGKQC